MNYKTKFQPDILLQEEITGRHFAHMRSTASMLFATDNITLFNTDNIVSVEVDSRSSLVNFKIYA